MELKHKGWFDLSKLEDYETIFDRQARDVYPSFSKKQNKALNRYCHFGGPDRNDVAYDQINECIELIMNNKSIQLPNKYEKSALAIVSSFQHSAKIDIPVLYRGIRREPQAAHLATLKVGDIYESKQAMSTSHSAFVAFSNLDQNVALKVYGTHGIPLRHNYAEGEVLIDPRTKFRIRDIYLEDWNDGKSTKADVLVYELVMLPNAIEKRKSGFLKALTEYLFYTITTLFLLSMLRTSFLTPQLLNATNALRYDYNDLINDPNQRQLALIGSTFGYSQPFFVTSLVLFACLWFCIFTLPYGKKLRKTLIQIFGATVTGAGILVTIFSVWRVS